MPKHLLINSTAGNYRLLPDEDAVQLEERLHQAVENGDVIEVDYQLGNDPRAINTVTINGAAVATYSIVELPEPGPVAQVI